MLIWGLLWGGLLGLLVGNEAGLALGLALGWLAGLTLRICVRNEIRQALDAARTGPGRAQAAGAGAAAAGGPGRPDAPPPLPGHALPAARATAGQAVRAMPAPAAPAAPATPPPLPPPSPFMREEMAGQAASAAASPTAEWPASEWPTSEWPASEWPAARANAGAGTRRAPAPLAALRQWLLGGNAIMRAGLVILFIGLAFLARYAAQANLLPLELRLAAVGLAGLALLCTGFGLRARRPDFALPMQGAGVAVMYLTVFAAFRLQALDAPLLAFGLMVAVCAGGCVLALLQDARALALLAFAGGFATPVLLSSGGGSHVALFGYYLVLNLGILWLAARRAWRALNLLGFVATFGVATAWGVLRYVPAHYASAQFFLLAFAAIYVAAALLYARRAPMLAPPAGPAAPPLALRERVVDVALVFGTPLAAFGLQAGLVRHVPMGAAFSALGFGAAYLLLAAMLARRGLPPWQRLVECFVALGLGFATLAVPLALDARWTSAAWALEGLAAFWVGARQARWLPRALGLGLQLAALLALGGSLSWHPVAAWPLAHPAFMGMALLALAALGCAWLARAPLPHGPSRWARGWAGMERQLPRPLFIYGFVLWCAAWSLEWGRRLPPALLGDAPAPVWPAADANLLQLLSTLLSAGAGLWLARRLRWPVAAWPSLAALPLMAAALLNGWALGQRVLDGLGPLLWPLALALHALFLLRNEQAGGLSAAIRRWLAWQHPAGLWLLLALLADVLWALIDRAGLRGTAWASVSALAAAIAVLAALTALAGPAARPPGTARWPLRAHAAAYLWTAALPIAALTLLGALAVACTSSGHTAPLPYIPLLNPTDLCIALALGSVLLWRRAVLAAAPPPAGSALLAHPAFWVVTGLLALVAASSMWLRVAHHFFGVAWRAGALFDSFVVQTGYSLLWTLLALGLMVAAHRRALRPPWLAGAALLALVVLKLALVDLANRDGAERIVAFIGVGLLMLATGYFAPLPPRPAPPAQGGASAKIGP